jgi:hypothetical protein
MDVYSSLSQVNGIEKYSCFFSSDNCTCFGGIGGNSGNSGFGGDGGDGGCFFCVNLKKK